MGGPSDNTRLHPSIAKSPDLGALGVVAAEDGPAPAGLDQGGSALGILGCVWRHLRLSHGGGWVRGQRLEETVDHCEMQESRTKHHLPQRPAVLDLEEISLT